LFFLIEYKSITHEKAAGVNEIKGGYAATKKLFG
jgi:hypothetical protein